MFEECCITLSRTGDIFYETDSFGLSFMAQIIVPMIAEFGILANTREENFRLLAEIDSALAEIRSMEG